MDAALFPDVTGLTREYARTIIKTVAQHFELTVAELLSITRISKIRWPRQVTAWFLREAGLSYPQMGLYLGGMHHSTMMHSVAKVEKLRQEKPEFAEALERLRVKIQSE